MAGVSARADLGFHKTRSCVFFSDVAKTMRHSYKMIVIEKGVFFLWWAQHFVVLMNSKMHVLQDYLRFRTSYADIILRDSSIRMPRDHSFLFMKDAHETVKIMFRDGRWTSGVHLTGDFLRLACARCKFLIRPCNLLQASCVSDRFGFHLCLRLRAWIALASTVQILIRTFREISGYLAQAFAEELI